MQTPTDLITDGLYTALAVAFVSGKMHRRISHALFAKSIGAIEDSAARMLRRRSSQEGSTRSLLRRLNSRSLLRVAPMAAEPNSVRDGAGPEMVCESYNPTPLPTPAGLRLEPLEHAPEAQPGRGLRSRKSSHECSRSRKASRDEVALLLAESPESLLTTATTPDHANRAASPLPHGDGLDESAAADDAADLSSPPNRRMW